MQPFHTIRQAQCYILWRFLESAFSWWFELACGSCGAATAFAFCPSLSEVVSRRSWIRGRSLLMSCLLIYFLSFVRLFVFGPYRNDGWFIIIRINWLGRRFRPSLFNRILGVDGCLGSLITVAFSSFGWRLYLLQSTIFPVIVKSFGHPAQAVIAVWNINLGLILM